MRQLWGIDGGQGSGKTTYAQKILADLLATGTHAIYIETDDFLSERSFRNSLQPAFFDDITNLRLLFDFECLGEILKEFLVTTKAAITVTNLYNSTPGTRDRSQSFALQADTIILVGGPYLLQTGWPQFDHKVFLNLPEPVRLERTLERNRNKDRSEASQRALFANFEKFYQPYWGSHLSEYDEVLDTLVI